MRKLLFIVLCVTVLTAAAFAQLPTKGNVFFGYSYNRAEIVSNDAVNLNGWNASLEGNFLPWIGIVGDLGGTYGSHAIDTSFANAVGGGLDYQIFGPVSVRGQLDWIHTRFFGNGQNDVRFSTGIAVHF